MNRCPDIVVLDKDLDDGDGYDVLRQIKAHSQVPVIFLSGNNDEPEVVKVLELGADWVYHQAHSSVRAHGIRQVPAQEKRV